MKLKEYLRSNLLPRREKTPDIWSNERYWGLPDSVSVYTDGFNCTTYDKQGKPLIQDLQNMTPEKYQELEKYEDCEVVRITCMGYENNNNRYCVGISIHIDLKGIK